MASRNPSTEYTIAFPDFVVWVVHAIGECSQHIGWNTRLDAWGLDSLAMCEFLVMIEDDLGAAVNEDAVVSWTTLGDVFTSIRDAHRLDTLDEIPDRRVK